MIAPIKYLLIFLILTFTDLILFQLSFFSAINIYNIFNKLILKWNSINIDVIIKAFWFYLVFFCYSVFEKNYLTRRLFWDEAKILTKIIVFSLTTLFIINRFLRIFNELNIFFYIIFCFVLILVFYVGRFFIKLFLYDIGLWRFRSIIIGFNDKGVDTFKGILKNKFFGYYPLCFIDENAKEKTIEINNKKVRIFNRLDKLGLICSVVNIDTIFIVSERISEDKKDEIINKAMTYVKSVIVIPDLKGFGVMNSLLEFLFDDRIYFIKIVNNLNSSLNLTIKRIFDLTFAILLIPFLIPVIALIGIIIKIDSKGPVFHIQDRLGKNGKYFKCIKFRTMYVNADSYLVEYFKKNPEAEKEWKIYKKIKGYDPRITKVGKFLRKTSLDEIPQIFNILMGSMGFVGPRPYLPREIDDMGDYKDDILMTAPGITGLWQISGRNEVEFAERLKLDEWYIQNWSLWLDISIIVKTFEVILKRKGAY